MKVTTSHNVRFEVITAIKCNKIILDDLTNWYKYQQHMITHHIDLDDEDQGDLRNVGF
jgi:hypothetical protein